MTFRTLPFVVREHLTNYTATSRKNCEKIRRLPCLLFPLVSLAILCRLLDPKKKIKHGQRHQRTKQKYNIKVTWFEKPKPKILLSINFKNGWVFSTVKCHGDITYEWVMIDSYRVATWALKSRQSLRSLLTLKKEKNNKHDYETTKQ